MEVGSVAAAESYSSQSTAENEMVHWAKSQHVGPRPKYPWVPLKSHVMLGKSPNLSGLVFSSLKWV